MKIAERIIMLLLLFCLLGGGAWLYFSVQYERQEVRDAVARGDFEIADEDIAEAIKSIKAEDWQLIYPNTVPLTIGEVSVQASVADSLSERIRGLSRTPFLPSDVVKLFAFGAPGEHSIWMKDMEYSLDIIWVSENGEIVHIENDISPDSYPDSFASPVPAWYVIEAQAGFVASNTVAIGDKVVLVQ